MKLTKASDYAIISLCYLALQEGKIASVRQISDSMGIPKDFLSRIFHKLPFIKAFHGNKGGYTLAVPADQIQVRQVLEAIEGNVNLNLCTKVPVECSRIDNCSIAGNWQALQNNIDEILRDTSIADLISQQTPTADTAQPDTASQQGA